MTFSLLSPLHGGIIGGVGIILFPLISLFLITLLQIYFRKLAISKSRLWISKILPLIILATFCYIILEAVSSLNNWWRMPYPNILIDNGSSLVLNVLYDIINRCYGGVCVVFALLGCALGSWIADIWGLKQEKK